MKHATKSHLDLSKSNGILADVVDARKQGCYTRSKQWSANGDTKNRREDRRNTRQQLRNYL